MTLAQLTTEDINAAIARALEKTEGGTPDEWNRPWVYTAKPFAVPPVVVYQSRDGKRYQRTYAVAIEDDAPVVTLGATIERVEPMTVWTKVEFALPAEFSEDGEFIVREGKVFECGTYPDKNFSLTPAEADAVIAAGQAVPNDLEHIPTVLTHAPDGNKRTDILGDTVLTRREGSEVFGKVRIPKWLHEKLGDSALKVSATWNRATKSLEGMALCLNPRIPDAAVFATFVATPAFQDFKAEHPSEAAKIVTLAAHPAPEPATPMNPQQIKEAAWTTFSADPKNAGVTRDQFEAAFSNTPAQQADTTPAADLATEARIKTLEAQLAQQAAQFAATADATAAALFYEEQLKAGRVGPAMRNKVEREFLNARKLDRLSATFSEGTQGESEKAVREDYSKLPALVMFGGGFVPQEDQTEKKAAVDYGFLKDEDFTKKPQEAK